MGSYKIPYLVHYKNHYYWRPKPAYKVGGFKTVSLGKDKDYAISKANKLNLELINWRKGNITRHTKEGTIAWLAIEWQKDDSFKALSDKTRKGYQSYLDKLGKWSGDKTLEEITRMDVKELYRTLSGKRRMAEEAIKVGRRLFNFARDMELIKSNPFEKQGISKNPPRNLVWSNLEIQKVKDKAIAESRFSVALGVIIAVETGQRQGDILQLKWEQYQGGKLVIRQSKTGAEVRIPCSIELKNMLALADDDSDYIVTSEVTKKPYKTDDFKKWFRELATLAGINPALQFLDLRRTAAVRLSQAGCTPQEVAAITGHKIDTSSKILDVYIPRNEVVASTAIKKLERYKVTTFNPKPKKRLQQKGANNG